MDLYSMLNCFIPPYYISPAMAEGEEDACSVTRSRRSSGKSSCSCDLGENVETLPTCTSQWTNVCLSSLGIYYNDKYHSSPHDILDLIFSKTKCFGPIEGDRKKHLESTKRRMAFDCCIEDLYEQLEAPPLKTIRLGKGREKATRLAALPDLLPVLNEDLNKICRTYTSGSHEEDFLIGVRNVITLEVADHLNEKYRMSQGPVSEDLYLDIFKTFVKLCQIAHLPGSVWKAKMDIQNQFVTSTADLLLIPGDPARQEYMNSDSLAIVSVVQMTKGTIKTDVARDKKLTRKLLQRYDTDSASTEHNAEICDHLDDRVLGQHGGELLMHYPFYAEELDTPYMKYMPGIIVIGTQVIFTVLEIEGSHYRSLSTKRESNMKFRGTIYYSLPKNFLKKEDRDILLESLMRLNNT